MKLLRESSIRDKSDEPVNKMLDLWHSLCKENLGCTLEVLAGNRHENPEISSMRGELNTTCYHRINNKDMFVLWLENLNKVEMVIITHELGHWILFLQGFKAFATSKKEYKEIEIFLNSTATHPALYILQKSIGHNPQIEIDNRVKHNIELFSRECEPLEENIKILNSLMLADDIINGSKELTSRLRDIISSNHHETNRILERILKLVQFYDLSEPHRVLRFMKKVVKDLNLSTGNWFVRDNIFELREKIKSKP